MDASEVLRAPQGWRESGAFNFPELWTTRYRAMDCRSSRRFSSRRPPAATFGRDLFFRDSFRVECPTDSGRLMNLFEVALDCLGRTLRRRMRERLGF